MIISKIILDATGNNLKYIRPSLFKYYKVQEIDRLKAVLISLSLSVHITF